MNLSIYKSVEEQSGLAGFNERHVLILEPQFDVESLKSAGCVQRLVVLKRPAAARLFALCFTSVSILPPSLPPPSPL